MLLYGIFRNKKPLIEQITNNEEKKAAEEHVINIKVVETPADEVVPCAISVEPAAAHVQLESPLHQHQLVVCAA